MLSSKNNTKERDSSIYFFLQLESKALVECFYSKNITLFSRVQLKKIRPIEIKKLEPFIGA